MNRMERRTRYEHVQQARARTNIPVMMMLLVLLTTWAVLAESPGGERSRRSFNVHEWCLSNVEERKPVLMTTGPYKDNVVGYCIDIVYNYFIMPDDEKGCMKLRDLIRSQYSYSSYFGYTGTARMVYTVLCIAPTTATTATTNATATPPTAQNTPSTPTTRIVAIEEPKPQEECGRSESLKTYAQGMLSRSKGRILGGVKVNDCSMVPWQVQLKIGGFVCGGSIIGARFILTASHCLQEVKSRDDVKVIVSVTHLYDEDSDRQEVSVRNITKHRDFHPVHFVSDIGIVTLEDPIEFDNPCLEIICRNRNFDFDGKYCLVSGWGKEEVKGPMSSTLKIVMLQASHGKKCKRKFGIQKADYVYDEEQMLCAGHVAGGKDSCKGDSGGALVCLDADTDRFVQVGVVSYGTGCGDVGFPGIYSNVAYFDDWINKIMAENNYVTDSDD